MRLCAQRWDGRCSGSPAARPRSAGAPASRLQQRSLPERRTSPLLPAGLLPQPLPGAAGSPAAGPPRPAAHRGKLLLPSPSPGRRKASARRRAEAFERKTGGGEEPPALSPVCRGSRADGGAPEGDGRSAHTRYRRPRCPMPHAGAAEAPRPARHPALERSVFHRRALESGSGASPPTAALLRLPRCGFVARHAVRGRSAHPDVRRALRPRSAAVQRGDPPAPLGSPPRPGL